MRIGIIAPPWLPVPPPRYGGTEAVVDVLARSLTDLDHDVLLWTTGDATCPVRRGWLLREHRWDEVGRVSIEAPHVVDAYEAIGRWGADVVHDHTVAGALYGWAVSDVPVVVTNHGPFDELASRLYRSVVGRMAVVAISHDQAARADGVEVTAVIHHGVDLDAFPVGRGGGDRDGPYVAFLGRMSPDKGVTDAIELARAADLRLLIAAKMADRDEQRYFEESVEPCLGGGVDYIGEIGPADRARLLGDATALLNPIRWPEPFGLVMAEALACGTPVVTTTCGSALEIVDDGVTGFVCKGRDDLVEALADAATLDRAACRAAAEERFSARRMAQDHVGLYERLRSGDALC